MGPGAHFLGDQNQIAAARYDLDAMTAASLVRPNEPPRCAAGRPFQQQTAQLASLAKMLARRAVRKLKCGPRRGYDQSKGGRRQCFCEKPRCAQHVANFGQHRTKPLGYFSALVSCLRRPGPTHMVRSDVTTVRKSQAHGRALVVT